ANTFPFIPICLTMTVTIQKDVWSDEATPYAVLSRFNRFGTPHEQDWWKKTGRLLSKVLEAAQYSQDRQYEALLFYSQVLIPRLGPYPSVFRSAITRSGLPLEFSVNYQQHSVAGHVVRIGLEPVAEASGTTKDPYNQKPIIELLDKLEKLGPPGFNVSLFNHFLEAHTLSEQESQELGADARPGTILTSQAAFGFDLQPETISVKGYTFPGLKTQVKGQGFGSIINKSLIPLKESIGPFPAFDLVDAYMAATDGYSQFAFWSFDCADNKKARLKLYSAHNSVLWSKIQEIWTLGGRVDTPVVQKGLDYLRELWRLTGISEGDRAFTGGFDDGKDATPTPMVWNYEMRVGEAMPLTKFYFPVHGENDERIIRGLAKFLAHIGLVSDGNNLENVIQGFYPNLQLSKTSRLISWISFAYTEKTGVYLSVYYHSSEDYPWAEEEAKA
ncbi:DMATS type aromatic prenyltransferase, partial [Penicillium lividum]